MDEPVRRYLADLVAAAKDVLGENLVGAYAAGSVGLAAYQPGRSDIDVALVCEHALPAAQKHELVAGLRHEALPCPARGLELVVYRRSVALSGSPDPGFEVELNTGARMDFRETYAPEDRPESDGRFWYALDRSILHQSGQALLGPPAADMFTDVTPADLRQTLIRAPEWWLGASGASGASGAGEGGAGEGGADEPAPGAEDAVLGACRSLVKFRDDVWLSKIDAGRRLIATGYPPDLIERCIAARRGGAGSDGAGSDGAAWGEVAPSGQEARAFQRRVLAEIRGPV